MEKHINWRKEQSTKGSPIKELLHKHATHPRRETPPEHTSSQPALQGNSNRTLTPTLEPETNCTLLENYPKRANLMESTHDNNNNKIKG